MSEILGHIAGGAIDWLALIGNAAEMTGKSGNHLEVAGDKLRAIRDGFESGCGETVGALTGVGVDESVTTTLLDHGVPAPIAAAIGDTAQTVAGKATTIAGNAIFDTSTAAGEPTIAADGHTAAKMLVSGAAGLAAGTQITKKLKENNPPPQLEFSEVKESVTQPPKPTYKHTDRLASFVRAFGSLAGIVPVFGHVPRVLSEMTAGTIMASTRLLYGHPSEAMMEGAVTAARIGTSVAPKALLNVLARSRAEEIVRSNFGGQTTMGFVI